MSLTSFLYRAARASATARAASRGPVPLAKRQVRKTVYKHSSRAIRKGLRGFGL